MNSTGQVLTGFAIWAAIIGSYFTPAIVALIRRVPNAGSVVIIDLLLGWSIIGWIIALAMACRSKPPQISHYPPPYNQPGYYPQQPRS